MKERAFLILSVFLVNISYASTQYGGLITRMEYIDMYKDIAIREMLRTGVPASLKQAQGMLESDNGNSRLAVRANNHFGIKCHNGWNGR